MSSTFEESVNYIEVGGIFSNEFTDENIRKLLERMNPNFPFIFDVKLFRSYLETDYPDLKNLLIALINERPTDDMEEIVDFDRFPDIYSIKDGELRLKIFRLTGLEPNYTILNHINGRLMIKKISNRDAPTVANYILSKISSYRKTSKDEYDFENRYNHAREMLSKFKDKVEDLKTELGYEQGYPILPADIKKAQKMDKLRKKLYGNTSLFD